MIQFQNTEYRCMMELAMDIIGGKWKAIILWHLTEKTLRFNEIRSRMPQATHKMLTQQLRALENDQLISRCIYPEVPPRVEYSLTEIGKSVIPVLEHIKDWSCDYMNQF